MINPFARAYPSAQELDQIIGEHKGDARRLVPQLTDEQRVEIERQNRAEQMERDRIAFRIRTFHEMAAAGSILPSLPAEVIDRFLDRMWKMLHQPEEPR